MKSKFRASFKLKDKEMEYIRDKGIMVITEHAYQFVNQRLKIKLENDGKQTPMRGHPVFIAMHATGCCCRGCLEKWHHIKSEKELEDKEINYIVYLIITWIKKEMENKKST